MPRAEFILKLRDEPGNRQTPVASRLKAFLKVALRAYGLRCVEVSEVEQQSKSEATP